MLSNIKINKITFIQNSLTFLYLISQKTEVFAC